MAVSAGPSPWSEGFRKVNKSNLAKQGMEWSLSSGYRVRQEGGQPSKPKTKQVTLYNGRTVEVPDADYDDFIGHHVSPDSDPNSEIGKYIDNAFEIGDNGDFIRKVYEFNGVGHITLVEYSLTYQLMRVEFTNNGAVVVFFRVPKEVYSELKYLADSGRTMISPVDGKERHVLGMRFWDIIRIRGQKTGSRYRYEYVIHGERSGSKFEQEIEKGSAELTAEKPKAAAAEERMAAKRGKTANEELYDDFAKNFLSGSRLDEYKKLGTEDDKARFLYKAGIL